MVRMLFTTEEQMIWVQFLSSPNPFLLEGRSTTICRKWYRRFVSEKQIGLGFRRLFVGFVVNESDEIVPVTVDLYTPEL
jgi:hypothetical protein